MQFSCQGLDSSRLMQKAQSIVFICILFHVIPNRNRKFHRCAMQIATKHEDKRAGIENGGSSNEEPPNRIATK